MKNILSTILSMISTIYSEWKLFLWNLNKNKIYNLRVYKDYKFKFIRYGDITRWMYQLDHLVKYEKGFENKAIELYLDSIKEGDTILDIGANIGLFSLLGSRKIKGNGKIFAFEPSEKIFDALNENLRINECHNVSTFKLALSDKEGFLELKTPKSYHGSDAFAYLNNGKESLEDQSDFHVQKVKVSTIDNFIHDQNIKKVDFIKIDIEGAELLCFKGADNLLSSNNRPVILFECFEDLFKERFNYTMMDLLKYLDNKNYSITQFENWQWIAIPK